MGEWFFFSVDPQASQTLSWSQPLDPYQWVEVTCIANAVEPIQTWKPAQPDAWLDGFCDHLAREMAKGAGA